MSSIDRSLNYNNYYKRNFQLLTKQYAYKVDSEETIIINRLNGVNLGLPNGYRI